MNCERARRMAHEISCSGSRELAAEPGLSGMAELEEHLWSCPACRAKLQELTALRRQLRALGNRSAPPDFASRTMSAVRLQQRRSRSRRARRPLRLHLRRALAAAAAAAAVAAAGAYFATHRPEAPTIAAPVKADVAPLVMEYTDFRAAQPFGDRDGMAMFRARADQERREQQR